MRRKLTALMALLTLAVAGAIAPTAAAEELEAEYRVYSRHEIRRHIPRGNLCFRRHR